MDKASLKIYNEWAIDELQDKIKSTLHLTSSTTSQKKASDENDEQTTSPANASQTAAISQTRRLQVRKAQIRHRERKANHIKEMELLASQLRHNIDDEECEISRLRVENKFMKARLGIGSYPDLGMHQPSRLLGSTTNFSSAPKPRSNFLTPTNILSASESQEQQQGIVNTSLQDSFISPSLFDGGNNNHIQHRFAGISLAVDQNIGAARFHVELPVEVQLPSQYHDTVNHVAVEHETAILNFILSYVSGFVLSHSIIL